MAMNSRFPLKNVSPRNYPYIIINLYLKSSIKCHKATGSERAPSKRPFIRTFLTFMVTRVRSIVVKVSRVGTS